MARKIIYTRADGGISIVSVPPQLDETAALDAAMARLPATAISPAIVDESVVPTDRTFRNAWIKVSSTVVQDMPKCRELWRAKLRELRAPKMEALDMAYLRADETGDTTEKLRIAAQKQALRDVTADPRIEAAQTPGALKAVIPDALKTLLP